MRTAVARVMFMPNIEIGSASFESSIRAKACSELERLFEPCDELLLGRGAVDRRALRYREAGGVATQDVVSLVREVHLDLCESHLARRGAIGVLVGGHRLGGGDQNAREPLMHGAQPIRDG